MSASSASGSAKERVVAVIRLEFEVEAVRAGRGEAARRGADVRRQEKPVARNPDEGQGRKPAACGAIARVEQIHRAGEREVRIRIHAGREERALMVEVALDVEFVARRAWSGHRLCDRTCGRSAGEERFALIGEHRDLASELDAGRRAVAGDANRFARHRVESDAHRAKTSRRRR